MLESKASGWLAFDSVKSFSVRTSDGHQNQRLFKRCFQTDWEISVYKPVPEYNECTHLKGVSETHTVTRVGSQCPRHFVLELSRDTSLFGCSSPAYEMAPCLCITCALPRGSFKTICFYFIYVHVCLCECMPCVCGCPWRPERVSDRVGL